MAKARVIYFDGVCNLCNGFVRFIIRHERGSRLKFASLQSPPGIEAKKQASISEVDISTILFDNGEKILKKSEAVFAIASHLRTPYSWTRIFYILPQALTDRVYNVVAKNRYRWFGKEESCLVPTGDIKDRFLD